MDSTPPPPLDALWRPASVMAVILAGEALALVLALAPVQPPGSRLVLFGLASLGIQWVALATLCALFLLRRLLTRLTPLGVAWVCLGLLLGMTLLVSVAAGGLLGLTTGPMETGRADFVLRMLAIALVVGLIGLLTYRNYWAARRLAIRAKQLELEALQARIRPHFLFNTLNTGAALVRARPNEAERVLLDLADLFRCALSGPQRIPLADELALTRRYLDIESLRFGERLRLKWHIPGMLPDVQVPSLSLQPLVENAIRHGIERLPQGGRVDVSMQITDIEVIVTVGNDMPDFAGASGGYAVGLSSARERVDALTKGRGRVEARVEDGRYLARMVLPLE